jgi:hypothetical protein
MAELSIDGAIHYVCMTWRYAFELLTAGRKVFAELNAPMTPLVSRQSQRWLM